MTSVVPKSADQTNYVLLAKTQRIAGSTAIPLYAEIAPQLNRSRRAYAAIEGLEHVVVGLHSTPHGLLEGGLRLVALTRPRVRVRAEQCAEEVLRHHETLLIQAILQRLHLLPV